MITIKRIIYILVLFFPFMIVDAESNENGLVIRNNNTYYYINGIMQTNTWFDYDKDGKNDYYFGNDGISLNGVQKIDNKWYYFIDNKLQYATTDGTYYYGRLTGTRQYNYWWDKDIDGKNDYYFGSDGKIVNNVQKIDNKWYYFINNQLQYASTDGTYYYGRLTGTRQYNYWWDKDADEKNDYYFGSDGKIVNNIQKIDNKWYYFIDTKLQYGVTDGTYYYGKATGTRQYNYWWDKDIDGKNDYYFGKDGKQVKNGWYDYNSDEKNDYYFDSDGKPYDGVCEIDNKWYYFINNQLQYASTDGTYYYGRLTGTRQYNYWWDKDIDGKNDYYFGSDGKIVNNVQKIDNKWYYFIDTKLQYGVTDGTYYYGKATGTRQYNYWWDKDIDGKNDYYFGNDGKQVKNGWYDYNSDEKNDYYFDSDGKPYDGVCEIDNKWYYFINNQLQYAATDGTYYYGRLTGTRQYNYWWDKDGDGKSDYYFNAEGKMVYGSQLINDKYYYFNTDGKMVYGAFKTIDGKKYYYGKATGTRQYGWLSNGGKMYYLDPTTGEVKTGKVIIDNVEYEFNADGTWKAGWVIKNGKKYYYYTNGTKATGWVIIAGSKCFFNSNGELIQENALKIIDVSVYQGNINWNTVKSNGIDGAIIRLGYGTSYTTDACVLDTKFDKNYREANNLGMVYGIYLYSYAIDKTSATLEGNFVLNKLKSYGVNKSIPIYYDLEENKWTTNLSKANYDTIVSTFANILEKNGYTVKVYSYKYWAENKLGTYAKNKLNWIAQYSNNCTYNGSYIGWQYTSTGRVSGINGDVDISVFKR